MEQLQMMKQKMEEIKENLEHVKVTGESAEGAIKVTANGNRKIKSISITDELRFAASDELEEQLTVAINRALEKSEEINEREMKSLTMGMLPPGMF